MHIVDGVLSLPVLAAGGAVTLCGAAYGLRQLSDNKIPQAAVLAACFFVASLVHIPIGPSSVHLIFNGLAGLLLGWSAFPVVLIGLVLQAVFFGFGGVLVLGVNAANIAVPAVLLGILLRPRLSVWPPSLVGFIACSSAVVLTSLMVAASLFLSGDLFINSASLVIVSHLPIALLEGVVGAFAVKLLMKTRPALTGIADNVVDVSV